MKTKFRSVLYDTAAIVGGSFLLGSGLIMFTVPSNIAPGGVSGLATALPISSLWVWVCCHCC